MTQTRSGGTPEQAMSAEALAGALATLDAMIESGLLGRYPSETLRLMRGQTPTDVNNDDLPVILDGLFDILIASGYSQDAGKAFDLARDAINTELRFRSRRDGSGSDELITTQEKYDALSREAARINVGMADVADLVERALESGDDTDLMHVVEFLIDSIRRIIDGQPARPGRYSLPTE
jgi:hypothetical protein